MQLIYVGKRFKLDVNNKLTTYGVHTYETVNMGACSIQSALYILKDDDDKHHFV